MKLANVFSPPSRVLTACALLLLSACASKEPLNTQLSTSRDAVDQARIAGAAQAAPADFNSAVDKLDRATTAAKNRDQHGALLLAQQAQVDANLAHAKTDSAQAKLAADELARSNQILREVASRAKQNEQR